MPFNSTKVDTTSKVIANTGGNFEGVNIFNGATASVVYICDNIIQKEILPATYNNDPTVTLDDTSFIKVGYLVTGTGIPADTKIASITNSTTIELTNATTGGNTNGDLEFESLENTLCKFHIAADSTYFYRGFNLVCRNGIKVVATDWSNLEVFTLHN